MKKVIFCLETMVLGGVEKELITVLKKMNPHDYNVTVLLLYVEDEEIIKKIPQWVHLIQLDIDKKYYCSSSLTIVKNRIRHGKYFEAGAIALKRALGIGMTQSNQSISGVPPVDEHYDVAICYHIHSPLTVKYVVEKISATKKTAWIHNDFTTTGYEVGKIENLLKKYDEVVAVSNTVMREFSILCPSCSNKVEIAHNILDDKEIFERALDIQHNEPFFTDNRVKILTIGRYTEQKGFDNAIEVCNSLRNMGYDFCWYLIGWGPEENQLRQMIETYKLNNCVSLLGKRDNPYPYINNCDIYVQPSRHEAWGLVVHEARILNKPIVCTAFAGSDEQIINGETGYIVSIEDNDALEEKIIFLIKNENERQRLSNNLKKQSKEEDFANILKYF